MKKTAPEKDFLNNPYLVPALYRGLKILELLSEHPAGLPISGMSSLGLPPASLYRMLMTLQECRYVVKEANEHYRLSRKILSLGYNALDEAGVIEKALPVMRKLRDASGETVLAAVLYGSEGVVLEQAVSNQAVKVTVQPGHHFPLHTAAPGKAILAFLPEDEREKLLESIKYTVFTKASISSADAMRKELAEVVKSGVAYDRGEELEDIRCVGAPVFNHAGYPVAAIWISGPASRMGSEVLKKHARLVKEYAAEISAKLR